GWVYEIERVFIVKGGKPREYTHAHVADVFSIELTLYERRERHARPRSSTDGKPIERLDPAALEALLARDHPDEWADYLAEGRVAGLSERLEEDEDEPLPGPFDGLLLDGPGAPLPPPDWYRGDDEEADDGDAGEDVAGADDAFDEGEADADDAFDEGDADADDG
ncbi:MAG TPA: hypothetical protein VFS00_32720, partial [Polyangiaceae bacterium]|nr:hypothetical protein [Polyangiaceae bacterium]